jgi:hypothetical protein
MNKKIKGNIRTKEAKIQPRLLKPYFPLEIYIPVIAIVSIAIPKISENQIHHLLVV